MKKFEKPNLAVYAVTLMTGMLWIGLLTNAQGQNANAAQNVITDVDDRPLPPGGMEAMYAYFESEMKYPELAKQKEIQGTVVTTFNVQKDGSVTDIEILRGIGGKCDEEAIRLIKSMEKWQAGKVNGEAVVTRMRIPIRFILP